MEGEEGNCEVTEVSKLEGEASINNRKGKLIFFYEWNLKATWTGKEKMRSLFNIGHSSATSGSDCHWVTAYYNVYMTTFSLS